MGARIEVRDLKIVAGAATLVQDIGFTVAPGQVLALIGESGSGKTTIALSLMGYARRGCQIASGTIRIGDVDVLALPESGKRALRGRQVAYIAQSAAAAFNPSRRILDQVIEPALLHGVMARDAAERKAIGLFRELALPDPDHIGQRYPHEVSGGQLQRVMAAMALIADPDVVIFDEPTTALDVTTQIEVLAAFRRAVRERNVTAIYVSHDLAVVAQMADHILVLQQGREREYASTANLLEAPQHDYTRSLLAAARPGERAPEAAIDRAAAPLLEVQGLSAGYGRGKDGQPKHLVLQDIGFSLFRGQAIGVIGESGSGKSTLARCIAGLIAPSSGSLRFDGQLLPGGIEARDRETLRRVQIVFQSADTALNPAQSIRQILERPLAFFHGMDAAARTRRVAELLDLVRLPASVASRVPAGLSGGQKQRVNLARALAAEPELILCDEVTSALDPVVAAAILDLIADLRREVNASYLFISHDLHSVRAVCDEIIVMRHGRQLAQVARADYARGPHHPYYEQLARSVPELRRGWLDDVLAAPGRTPEAAGTSSA
ncbi:ABC transporter ATP-binding protein [Luteimonas sp. RIT-PG2_3]